MQYYYLLRELYVGGRSGLRAICLFGDDITSGVTWESELGLATAGSCVLLSWVVAGCVGGTLPVPDCGVAAVAELLLGINCSRGWPAPKL